MIEYNVLTPELRDRLRRERVLALEGDHFRTTLLLEEETDPAERDKLTKELIDYRRRIETHISRHHDNVVTATAEEPTGVPED